MISLKIRNILISDIELFRIKGASCEENKTCFVCKGASYTWEPTVPLVKWYINVGFPRRGTSLLGHMGVCTPRISVMTKPHNIGGILSFNPRIWMWFFRSVFTEKQYENSCLCLNMSIPRIMPQYLTQAPEYFYKMCIPSPEFLCQRPPKIDAYSRMK